MDAVTIGPANDADVDFLWAMLAAAAFWRPGTQPVDDVRQTPELAVYLRDWGRKGDRAVVARVGQTPVAAAWLRLFTSAEHGFGWVDEHTPELSIAVDEDHRGVGIGMAVLAALLAQARLDGHRLLSLSVEHDNPAIRLYERLGFVAAASNNGARTMVRIL